MCTCIDVIKASFNMLVHAAPVLHTLIGRLKIDWLSSNDMMEINVVKKENRGQKQPL